MPKVSQDHLDSRRRQILEAAFWCFSRNGFHRTKMRDICREAGLSAGAVYTYFDSKEEIVEALASFGRETTRRTMQGVPEGRDSVDSLARLMEFFVDFLGRKECEPSLRLDLRLWGEALDNPKLQGLFRQGLKTLDEVTSDLVTRGQGRAEIAADLAADDVVRVVVSVFMGLSAQKAVDPTLDLSGCAAVLRSLLEGSFAVERKGRAKG